VGVDQLPVESAVTLTDDLEVWAYGLLIILAQRLILLSSTEAREHSSILAQVVALGLPRNRPVDRTPMTSRRQWRLKRNWFGQATELVAKGAAP